MSDSESRKLRRNALGYWEVENKPSETELQEYYARKYYQEARGSYEHTYTASELNYFRAKIGQRWAVIRRFIAGPGSLLDVGCGEGYTLAFFRELGWTVRGLDYSSAGIESKNPQCRDALVTGDLFRLIEQEFLSGNRYELIWLQNVLEHVIDPVRLLDELRRIVSPGGMLVVTVPNDFSDVQLTALERGLIDSEFWVALPDHLSYFSRTGLVNIGVATGWACVEVLADFPIDWFLYHPGSNYMRTKAAGKPAHTARVELENLINHRPIEDVVNFYSALARIDMGRDLTAFYRTHIE